jgi:hypothetical protein
MMTQSKYEDVRNQIMYSDKLPCRVTHPFARRIQFYQGVAITSFNIL